MSTLVWFRDDLRLADNPALAAAVAGGGRLICLYILEEGPGIRPLGAAGRWWLRYSLASLAASLGRKGQRLVIKRGAATRIVPAMVRAAKVDRAFWNRRYGAAAAVDNAVTAALSRAGATVETFSANLLFEPAAVRNRSGAPFRVFSSFWREALGQDEPRLPVAEPRRLPPPVDGVAGEGLESLGLQPTAPDWTGGIRDFWQPGEAGAAKRLETFLGRGLAGYAHDRDYPEGETTAMISPHLRFGEISPFAVWHAVAAAMPEGGTGLDKFRTELGWREFAWHILDQFPDLARRNFQPRFDSLRWEEPYDDDMWSWRRGRTGYPIVDAAMRQLWQTGWMHNRARMIAASFLVKHMLVDWRLGEEWFWDTLVDADAASNPFNWQWIAGTGADAQPFFRIFNPVTQGEKFDAEGAYVRRYVPELRALPDRFIHKPWMASDRVLKAARIEAYPLRMVDHSTSRARALAAFAQLRAKAEQGELAGASLRS